MVTISANNEDGFDVGLAVMDDEFTVFFEGWHQHFDSEDEALACLRWGLSKSCRLKVVKRGGTPISWTTQYIHDGAWIDDEVTGLILIPFWRRKSIVFKQNNVLDPR